MGAVQCCHERERDHRSLIDDHCDHYTPPKLSARALELDFRPTLSGDVPLRFSRDGVFAVQKRSMDWFYDMRRGKVMGTGAFGTVVRFRERGTGARRAVKMISKTGAKGALQEFDILKRLDHPHIVKLIEAFDDGRRVCMVMECCGGGDLFEYVSQHGALCERQAATVMRQLLSALLYLHQVHHIVHRDVKLDNVMLEQSGPVERTCAKLIDFGLSKRRLDDQPMKSMVGSPLYLAPELRSGAGYTEAIDLWASGVLLFGLVCNEMPFEENSDKLLSGEFATPAAWHRLSEPCRNFIEQLLQVCPVSRLCARRAGSQPWIQEHVPKRGALAADSKRGTMRSLRRFRQQHPLKRAVLRIIASQTDPKAVKHLRDTFERLDDEEAGEVSLDRFRASLACDEVDDDLPSLLDEVDSDGSGSISLTEFVAATMDAATYLQESVCAGAFRVLDKNGDGRISAEELLQLVDPIGIGGSADEVAKKLVCELDSDQDGAIDFDEFMAMMRSTGMR